MQAVTGKVSRKKALAMAIGADWAVEPGSHGDQSATPSRVQMPSACSLTPVGTGHSCAPPTPASVLLLCSVLGYDGCSQGKRQGRATCPRGHLTKQGTVAGWVVGEEWGALLHLSLLVGESWPLRTQ